MIQESINLRQMLQRCQTIAVVGLSDKPDRPSYTTAAYMQAQGYRIVPVNPLCHEILGERCYPSLLDIPFAVQMVNVFRKTDDVLPIAEQALKIGALCLWQQLDVLNEEADQLAENAGLVSVMDRCIKIEHQRLLRSK